MSRGHVLMVTGTVRWCLRCGCYSETVVRALTHDECNGKPSIPARWRAACQGMHPLHRWQYLGLPRRMTAAEWADMGGAPGDVQQVARLALPEAVDAALLLAVPW